MPAGFSGGPPMQNCAQCGRAIAEDGLPASVASGTGRFHLACAPDSLLQAVNEEWNAILRKGIRYFVEKYLVVPGHPRAEDTPPSDEALSDLGRRFLNFGAELRRELARRAKTANG